MQVLKEKVKTDIMISAQTLFIEKGYRETKMSDIALLAGISTSNLYHYFTSKEKIFYGLTENTAKQIKKMIERYGCDTKRLGHEELMEELFQELYNLLRFERQNLLLIHDCAAGTKYETLNEDLITAVAGKFSLVINNEESDSFILRTVAGCFLSSFISVLKYSQSDHEIYKNLRMMLQYHLAGVKTLIPK